MNSRANKQRRIALRNQAKQALAEGKVPNALETLNELIELGRVEAGDWLLACTALLKVREYAQALKVADNGLKLQPNNSELLYNKATAFFQLGDVTAAVELFEKVSKRTGSIIAWESLATIIPGCPRADYRRVLNARRKYAELCAADFKGQQQSKQCVSNPRLPNGRIRVGYLSAFFHRPNYMKPVWGLINGHDRQRFEIYLFADDCDESDLHWFQSGPNDRVHITSSLTNRDLVQLIVHEQLDILVDLNGYSVPKRLPVLTQRIAPKCVAWFNMYATSGMPSIDWIVGDEFVVQEGEDDHYSERVKRLPLSYLSFEVSHRAPDIVAPPSTRNGGFTFGSLISQYKMTQAVLDAWSEILRRTPQSRLLLANRALASKCNQDYLVAQFSLRGITAERLILKPPAEHFEYLQYYNQIDVALDAFPWNGGTTTTEAIWQGVPVLTFNGDRWASRTSRTLLMNSHLTEFVATDEKAFIEAAVAWGNDPESPSRLASLRGSMREQLQVTLCKMDQMVASMESFYTDVVTGEKDE